MESEEAESGSGSEGGDLAGESEQEEPEEQLEVPIEVRKLYNSFAGYPHVLTRRLTIAGWPDGRSGKTDGQSTPDVALYAAGERNESPRPESRAFITSSHETSQHLGPKPTTIHEARALPE